MDYSSTPNPCYAPRPRLHGGWRPSARDHLILGREGGFQTQAVRRVIPISKGGNATVPLGINTITGQLVVIKVHARP